MVVFVSHFHDPIPSLMPLFISFRFNGVALVGWWDTRLGRCVI
jgi:hypothetical protein